MTGVISYLLVILSLFTIESVAFNLYNKINISNKTTNAACLDGT